MRKQFTLGDECVAAKEVLPGRARKSIGLLSGLALSMALCAGAASAAYPDRPIRH
jgi:hypothetical protein